MQNKILDELVQEVERSSNAAYILKKADMFYDIGFRVMKNQEGGSLLDCHRLKYNGDIKLVYFTCELMTLHQILAEANIDTVSIAINNLMSAIERVESNGFLNVACIDHRLDHIFVEQNTLAVKLIYLPLNVPVSGAAKGNFESEIRAQLVKALQNICLTENPRVRNMVDVLTDGTIPLHEIARHIHVSAISEKTGEAKDYILASLNGSVYIPIVKNEFLVGKSRDKVDGIIEGNPAISRVHCKFMIRDGKIFIVDMKSANGTFVSGQRISSETYVEVQEGTRIKLANMEFIIRR